MTLIAVTRRMTDKVTSTMGKDCDGDMTRKSITDMVGVWAVLWPGQGCLSYKVT